MKKIYGIFGVLVICLLLLPASFSCSTISGGNIKAVLGQEFTLPVGQTAEIDSEGLSITFEGVISDSRCPKYAKCVSAGEAQCDMLFKLAGSPAGMTLTVSGGTGVTGSDYFLDYKITFKLEPHPEIGKDITPSDYQLVMMVTKS
jgi:hypothetical protein